MCHKEHTIYDAGGGGMICVLRYLMLFLYILQHLNCLKLIWESLTEFCGPRKTSMQLLGRKKSGNGKRKTKKKRNKISSENDSQ